MKKFNAAMSVVTIIASVIAYVYNEKQNSPELSIILGVILIIQFMVFISNLLYETVKRDMDYIEQAMNDQNDLDEVAFDEGMYVEPEQPQDGRRHKASRK